MKGLVVDGAAVVCRPGMVQFAVESSAASWTPWSGLDYALDLNVFFILVGCIVVLLADLGVSRSQYLCSSLLVFN